MHKPSSPKLLRSELSGFLLERTAKRMKQLAQQRLAEAEIDLTVDQWLVLRALQQEDGQSQYQLAQGTAKDAPTMTRIIDLLVKKDYCQRVPDPEDRRRFRIVLHPMGRRILKQALPIIQSVREIAWNGLEEAELVALEQMMKQVLHNLNEARNR